MNKKPRKDEAALKLALGSKLTTALVTQHHKSQADAESLSLILSTRTLLRTSRKTSGTGDRQ